MASDESEIDKMKNMEISEGRGKKYHFHFIGTIETYEDILDLDVSQFREEILDLFDIPYEEWLKTLKIAKDDDGNEEHQYKITCGYYLKITMDPNKYINEEFEKIDEEEYFEGAVMRGFDLNSPPRLIRYEGRFKRLHQKDYKKAKKQNKNDKYAKGLSKEDLEEDKERRQVIKQKKEMEAKRKKKRDKEKEEKHKKMAKEYADNHYQYDQNNPNYKKSDDQKEDD